MRDLLLLLGERSAELVDRPALLFKSGAFGIEFAAILAERGAIVVERFLQACEGCFFERQFLGTLFEIDLLLAQPLVVGRLAGGRFDELLLERMDNAFQW